MFYRGHPAADSIIRALCEEYLDEAGSDTVKLTQALVEMYGDLLFVAPTIQKVSLHSSKYLSSIVLFMKHYFKWFTYLQFACSRCFQNRPALLSSVAEF